MTAGPFGTAEDGGGSVGTSAVAPPSPLPAKPEPLFSPTKGPLPPPKVLNWTDPLHPEQARQQGVEGTVVLQVTVGADGSLGDVRVSRPSGHAMWDEAAVAHLRRARFSPALKDGKAVPVAIAFRVKPHLVNA